MPLLVWCALAVAVFAAVAFFADPTRLTATLGDTDDATRMIEVRELLAGHSWFDMTLPRFGGAHPLVSHWSRLIDLPIAMLLSAYELVLTPAQAELATRATWPLVLLLALLHLLARESEIRNGRKAALITILVAMACVGTVQFLPGRIDHHGAIILCAVIGLLRLARSFDDPNAGWSAGVFLGLANAIGYEALTLTAPLLGIAVLYGLLPRRSLQGPSNAAVTFAATLAIALSLTTPSNRLFVSHCDALSINMVALATIAAIGVCLVQAFETRLSTVAKLAILAATGVAGVGSYVWAEPACLAGPFGQVDPEVVPIWLRHVSETGNILSLPPQTIAITFANFAIALYCGARLSQTERDDALRFHLLLLLFAIPLSLWQIKLLPYALFLTAQLIGGYLGAAQPTDRQPMGKLTKVMFSVAMLLVIGGVSWIFLSAADPKVQNKNARSQAVDNCLATSSVTPLSELPRGLAVGDVNLGPFLVNLTQLDALSAPYHRLGPQIVEAHRIMHASPADAERRLRAVGARYVVVCNALSSTEPQRAVPKDALRTLLLAGKPPAFLQPVKLPEPTPLKVWQLKP